MIASRLICAALVAITMTFAACAGSGGTAGDDGPTAAASTETGATSDSSTTDASQPGGTIDSSPLGIASFAEVSTILDSKCVSCHGAEESEWGLSVASWEELMYGSSYGEAVIAFAPANSRLIELAARKRGNAHPAELDADTLTAGELGVIRSWIAQGAPSSDGTIPFSESRDLVYVTNQGEASVSIVDAAANVVARRVDLTTLGFSKTAKPHHVAVEPDGSHWYVSLIGENRVLKFDRANRLVDQAEFEVPGLLVLDSDNERLYVGRSMSAVSAPSRIGVIRTSDMSVDEIDVFIPRPHALAVAPGGETVFTASLAENTIATVDVNTYDTDLLRLGGNPEVLVQFAISPDGVVMVAGAQLSGRVHFFDIEVPSAISTAGALTIGAGPWHPVYSLDGKKLYVPNKMANTLTILDAESRSVASVLSSRGFAEPHGSALSPDGRYVYVSNNNLKGAYTPRSSLDEQGSVGTVVIVDTGTSEVVKVLEVGSNATGVGVRRPRQDGTIR